MTFLLNAKPIDALALIVHPSVQDIVGRHWVKKLREHSALLYSVVFFNTHCLKDRIIPRQLFDVPIQAAIGKKVIARETLKAMRADVTAGLYGGEDRYIFHSLFF